MSNKESKMKILNEIEQKFNIKTDNFIEEAMTIQENHGFGFDTPKWNDKDFLNHLKEIDPEDYEKFKMCKTINKLQSTEKSTDEKFSLKNVIKIDKELSEKSKNKPKTKEKENSL